MAAGDQHVKLVLPAAQEQAMAALLPSSDSKAGENAKSAGCGRIGKALARRPLQKTVRRRRPMMRTPVNPWSWSAALGYHQGEVVSGTAQTLYCAGQTATNGEGKPQHPGDIAAQIALCLDNLEAVLQHSDMSLANVVKLTIYATDVDQLFQNYGVLMGRLGPARATPPTTVLGVSRLALRELMVEIEAIAVA
jgi:enamine deaminase RidA (YjgF/YER057c/UK114 family)